MSKLDSFLKGISCFLSGFLLITRPGLRRYVILPLITNIILFTVLFVCFAHYVGILNAWFTSYLPTWLKWLGFLLWILFLGGFFLVFVYTFSTIANIIAAPFNGLLAEKTEKLLSGQSLPNQGATFGLKDIAKSIWRQISVFLYFIPRALLILLCFFIPIVHLFAGVIWFLFCAWLMSLTYLDYPADNKKVPLVQVRLFMHENKSLALGFGMAVLVMTLIPVINFIVMPAAVAGATKMWLEERHLRST